MNINNHCDLLDFSMKNLQSHYLDYDKSIDSILSQGEIDCPWKYDIQPIKNNQKRSSTANTERQCNSNNNSNKRDETINRGFRQDYHQHLREQKSRNKELPKQQQFLKKGVGNNWKKKDIQSPMHKDLLKKIKPKSYSKLLESQRKRQKSKNGQKSKQKIKVTKKQSKQRYFHKSEIKRKTKSKSLKSLKQTLLIKKLKTQMKQMNIDQIRKQYFGYQTQIQKQKKPKSKSSKNNKQKSNKKLFKKQKE